MNDFSEDGNEIDDFVEDGYSNRAVDFDPDDWDDSTGLVVEPPKPATPEEAQAFLRVFFADKKAYIGGPITESMLLTNRNVQMVLRFDLIDCIDFFHSSLLEVAAKAVADGEPKDSRRRMWRKERERLQLFFKLQAEAKKLEIKKAHSGGLLLVYLNICEGYEI